MKVYYDKDADLSLIKGKSVAIIGYGSQGHAHAQNLNDSGVKVTVGLRRGGASWNKVEKAGLKVAEVADAVKSADVVMILLPDEQIAAVYKNEVEPHIKQGASLAFAHGFNVHYGQVDDFDDLDQAVQVLGDLLDDFVGAGGHDGHARQRCVFGRRDRQALDVVAARREQRDHARQGAGLVFEQQGNDVFHGLLRRALRAVGGNRRPLATPDGWTKSK